MPRNERPPAPEGCRVCGERYEAKWKHDRGSWSMLCSKTCAKIWASNTRCIGVGRAGKRGGMPLKVLATIGEILSETPGVAMTEREIRERMADRGFPIPSPGSLSRNLRIHSNFILHQRHYPQKWSVNVSRGNLRSMLATDDYDSLVANYTHK